MEGRGVMGGERRREQDVRLLPVALWHPPVQSETKHLLTALLHSLRAREFWYSTCCSLDKDGISLL